MTNYEFFENVSNGIINDEVIAYASDACTKMEALKTKRAEKMAEKRAARETEREPVRKAIVEVLSEEPMTASRIIEAAGLEVKPQMIPSLMKPLVAEGVAARTEIKIVGKGKHVAYVKA